MRHETIPQSFQYQGLELEERFKKILIPIPQLSEQNKVDEMKKWLGEMVMGIFSHSFRLLELEKLDGQKIRCLCC